MAEEFSITAQQIQDFFYTEKITGSANGQNAKAYSVFTPIPNPAKTNGEYEGGFIPTSKAVEFDALTSGYFTINDIGAAALKSLGITSILEEYGKSTSAIDGTFWQIIVTEIQETHEESYSLHNTVADNVAVFATGAKPIAMSISGYVLISKSDDHNYALLKNYVDHFRARHLSAKVDASLTFRSQDTSFKLIIESINLGHTIEFETYVAVTIAGLAYDYGQTDSFENLDFSYYGKNRKTPGSRAELIGEEEEEKEEETPKSQEQPKSEPPYKNPDSDFVGPLQPKPWI